MTPGSIPIPAAIHFVLSARLVGEPDGGIRLTHIQAHEVAVASPPAPIKQGDRFDEIVVESRDRWHFGTGHAARVTLCKSRRAVAMVLIKNWGDVIARARELKHKGHASSHQVLIRCHVAYYH